jgi:hypothetical protein
MRILAVALIACALTAGAALADDTQSAAPVAADAQPDATVSLKGGSVALGIGYTWGGGELSYGGESHKFSISGMSIVDVGATNITATGLVYHLKNVSDFAGNYVAVSAGLTIAGGGSAVYLKNEHGVVMKLLVTDVGMKFNLAADGVHVTLKS